MTDQKTTSAEVSAPALSVVTGSALFKHVAKRQRAGLWVYRNFQIRTRGWHWKVCSANGDTYPVKSLTAARDLIDKWYAEGSVES